MWMEKVVAQGGFSNFKLIPVYSVLFFSSTSEDDENDVLAKKKVKKIMSSPIKYD